MTTIIGPHASISKGILNAIKYAESIQGNTLQIFLGSNQSTSLKMKTKITEEEIEEVRKYLKDNKIILVIHTVYLLNFCNHPPSSSQIKYALDNLIFDIELTARLGGIGCVLHLGYRKELDETIAYKNMVNNVKYAIDETNKKKINRNVKIILETPAGKGSQIGTTLEEFARLWNMFPKSYIDKRLGICVDTAHIFSSGRDISNVAGVKEYFRDFERLIGKKHLTLFHINDSKATCNSRKDLHEGIGDGYIFGKGNGSLLALKEIWKYAHKNRIPMVLETHSGGGPNMPKDNGLYQQEVELFRAWEKGLKPEKTFKLNHKKTLKKTINKTTKKSTKKSKTKQSPQNYKKYTNNKRIVKIFTELSDIYDLSSNNIRRNAYQKAIYYIKRHPQEIKNGEDLNHINGIGKKMIQKMNEIISTKNLKLLEELKTNLNLNPNTKNNQVKRSKQKQNQKQKLELEDVLGIGRKKAEELRDKHNITRVSQLKKKLSQNVKDSSKNTIKLTKQQEIGLQLHNQLKKKVSKGEAIKITNKIKKSISKNLKNLLKDSSLPSKVKINIELAGSLSQENNIKESKDIDILITVDDIKLNSKEKIEKSSLLPNIIKLLEQDKIISHTITVGGTKFLGICKLDPENGLNRHLDIRLVNKGSYIFAKIYYTSGREFNKIMRSIAKKKGYKLNEWGLFKDDKKIIINSERELFNFLEMDYIELQDRR